MVYNSYTSFIKQGQHECLNDFPFTENPFTLKGGGGLWFFLGKKNSVGKFDWKKNSVSEMGRKKILLALCDLKNFVFVGKK